jgi:hypothetical protein
MANKEEVVRCVKDWGCEQEFSVVPVIQHLENSFLTTFGDVEYGIAFLKPEYPGLEIESERLLLDEDNGEVFYLGCNDFFCIENNVTKAISYHSEDVSNSEVIVVWVC